MEAGERREIEGEEEESLEDFRTEVKERYDHFVYAPEGQLDTAWKLEEPIEVRPDGEAGEVSEGDLEEFRRQLLEDYAPQVLDLGSGDFPKEMGDDENELEGKEERGETGVQDSLMGTDNSASSEDAGKVAMGVPKEHETAALDQHQQLGQEKAFQTPESEKKDTQDSAAAASGREEETDKWERKATSQPPGNPAEVQAQTINLPTSLVETLSWNSNQTVITEQVRQAGDGGDRERPSVETPDLHGLQGRDEFKPRAATEGRLAKGADKEDPPSQADSPHTERVPHRQPNVENVLRAAPYNNGEVPVLRLPKGMFPEHRERELFQVTVAKERDPGEEWRLYVMHDPKESRGYLDLYQMDAKKREPIIVKEIVACDVSMFAQLYNSAKPAGLENTSLEALGGKISLKADGLSVPLGDTKFRTWQAKAVLGGTILGERLQIARGVDGTNVRLDSRLPVTSICGTQEGLRLRYTDRRSSDRQHTRLLRFESALANGNREHALAFEDSGLTLERKIGLTAGSALLRFSPENRLEAIRYWNLAKNPREKLVHQGDIGEFVAEAALRNSEFKVHQREEFGRPIFEGVHRSERTGPDTVFERDGSFYVGMVKAFANPHAGLKEAEHDVNGFVLDSQREEIEAEVGAEISGGLAIEVFWPDRESWGAINTEYVHFGGSRV